MRRDSNGFYGLRNTDSSPSFAEFVWRLHQNERNRDFSLNHWNVLDWLTIWTKQFVQFGILATIYLLKTNKQKSCQTDLFDSGNSDEKAFVPIKAGSHVRFLALVLVLMLASLRRTCEPALTAHVCFSDTCASIVKCVKSYTHLDWNLEVCCVCPAKRSSSCHWNLSSLYIYFDNEDKECLG